MAGEPCAPARRWGRHRNAAGDSIAIQSLAEEGGVQSVEQELDVAKLADNVRHLPSYQGSDCIDQAGARDSRSEWKVLRCGAKDESTRIAQGGNRSALRWT